EALAALLDPVEALLGVALLEAAQLEATADLGDLGLRGLQGLARLAHLVLVADGRFGKRLERFLERGVAGLRLLVGDAGALESLGGMAKLRGEALGIGLDRGEPLGDLARGLVHVPDLGLEPADLRIGLVEARLL